MRLSVCMQATPHDEMVSGFIRSVSILATSFDLTVTKIFGDLGPFSLPVFFAERR